MPVHVGTSGWQYKSWRGVLYPETVPQRRWLEHYTDAFATLESNNAFYRLPSHETFASWRARMPGDFVMAVKASRFLTHMKRLREAAEPVQRLLDAAAGLGSQRGPVLLQLPPTLQAEPDRLASCLALFPAHTRVAVEPRHESWWTPEIRDILSEHRAALCWADVRGRPRSPLWRTSSWGYVRMHEGATSRWPHYGGQALRTWARRITRAWSDDEDVFVYFNNDPGGAAVRNAAQFAAIMRDLGRTVTRTPRFDAGRIPPTYW